MIATIATYLDSLADRLNYAIAAVLLTGLILMMVEVVLPIEKQSWFSRLKGIVGWIVYVTLSVGLADVLVHLLGLNQRPPLLHFDLSGWIHSSNPLIRLPSLILLPFVPYFIFDFFYYWFHRFQHTYPWMWRFHAVHHSIEEMNSLNCNHHFLEELFRLPFIFIPTHLLFKVEIGEILPVFVLLSGWGQFIHTNTKFGFGRFRIFLADPRYHRIHHSIEERHFDKNFAAAFPILDLMFGTACFPAPKEQVRTGLVEVGEPSSLREFLIRPFRKKAV